MKDLIRQYTVIFTTLLTITVNILANALPINGLNTGQISDRFDVYFVPAGYVFSIWGLIYIFIIAYMIYQALPSKRESEIARATGWWFSLGNLANSIWIFLWHYLMFPATLAAMLVLLVSLIMVYLNTRQAATQGTAAFWAFSAPFSLYLGWISVATVANVTSLLDFLQWDRFGLSEEVWMVIILAVVTGLAWLMNARFKDVIYTLVFLWALAGIALKHASVPVVSISTWISFSLVLVSYLYFTLFRNRKELKNA